eukprot:scaffold11400_cov134-Isochrysis_galbana.AAC.4
MSSPARLAGCEPTLFSAHRPSLVDRLELHQEQQQRAEWRLVHLCSPAVTAHTQCTRWNKPEAVAQAVQ